MSDAETRASPGDPPDIGLEIEDAAVVDGVSVALDARFIGVWAARFLAAHHLALAFRMARVF